MLQDDGTFIIRGDAYLGNCDTVLDLKMDEEEPLKKFATHSGFFACVVEKYWVGDFVMSRGWCFEYRMLTTRRTSSGFIRR
jgi:hypothetical protein